MQCLARDIFVHAVRLSCFAHADLREEHGRVQERDRLAHGQQQV